MKSFIKTVLVALTLLLSACSGDSDDAVAGAELELGTEVNNTVVQGITQPLQTRIAEDGDGVVFPGQANEWDITSTFTLSDGSDDQFDGALGVSINASSYPSLTYSDLTFYSPLFGTSDGIVTAVVDDGTFAGTLEGSYTALLNRGVSKLYQDIDLTNASGDIALNAQIAIATATAGISGRSNTFQYHILDENGSVFEVGSTTLDGAFNIVDKDITSLTGQSIRLMFVFSNPGGFSRVDAVSVIDAGGAGTEYVTNGDFETGDLTGWSIVEPSMSQNYTATAQTLGNIDVTRSFYTKPDSLWGRWTDVYKNTTGAEINATIDYSTNLGTDSYEIISYAPSTSNQALSSWDGCNSDRDIGFVFGSADVVTFTSDDGLCDGNGDGNVYYEYNVTIPADGNVTLVNFILMSGKDTADTATDINARATEIDNEAKAIYDGMKSRNPLYLRGMTQEQIDTIDNF